MNKMIWRVGGLALVTALSACGGGGSDAGCSVFSTSCTTTGTGTGTTGSTTSDTGTVSTSSSGTVVLSLSSTTISASTPGTVTALVKNASGSPLANTLVTFAVSNGAATVSPARVITDDAGNASATLQPVAGAVGADYVSAAADVSTSSTLTTRTTFTVSAVNVSLASATASPISVGAYGASVITVDVVGASSASPVTVNFSSTCATAGKAVLSPTSVTVTGKTASTTYQDKACAATDRISATITGTSQQRQVDLAVAAPIAQALEFVSASPEKICLAGSGCEVSSVVSFRLKDQYNNPVAGREVAFSLDIPNVAILSPTTYKTNDSGIAQVSVTAKTIPSPVRVRADVTLDSGVKLSTVSNVLAINAGLPTQRAFSFSAAAYNPDGWARDGTESEIRVQLTDRFANPVPDGTSISFVAEGASIIPARCTTTNGICTVKLVTSNFRPTDGRVTVVAYAQGEESFDDADGDNQYTQGETYLDLGPIFLDKDENGLMAAAGEYLIGEPANNIWSSNTYVRTSRVFTLSDSSREPRLFAVNGDGSCSHTALPYQVLSLTTTGACRLSTRFCMRDANTAADALGGNPVPANATLTLATKAKGGSVAVDRSPVTGTWIGPTTHTVTADLDDCTKPLEASGPIDLTVKMPNGQSYKFDIGVLE
ncbi:Ig-like domain-containing protein [Sphaerotilus sp.]|uniref:Ig-like domain-containing protein n=1 Tax=Sphaerotilus sp. TaxID=2093942 RepID=UPI002ACDBE0C|nr:Ig-like domain-containing protein [Sphaerotilus sp.]MDZ7856677.1 Ig-like domain-containing protein [Sphaerotilus sp.]